MKAEPKQVKHFFFDENGKEGVYEVSYVVIPLLPEDQQKSFNEWIEKDENIDMVLIPEEAYYQWDCAFYNDYENWYNGSAVIS
jgi:hypothetical protein